MEDHTPSCSNGVPGLLQLSKQTLTLGQTLLFEMIQTGLDKIEGPVVAEVLQGTSGTRDR